MAITLDATIEGEHSNSYCTTGFADDYFTNHFDAAKASAWDALSDDQKSQLLVQACRILEMLRFTEPQEPNFYANYSLRYRRDLAKLISVANSRRPYKYTVTQRLQFPRNLDFYQDGTVYIPEELLMAQCEQAVYLLTSDESIIANQLQGVEKDTTVIGSGEITVSQTYRGNGMLISPLALQLVTPYLLKSGARLARS